MRLLIKEIRENRSYPNFQWKVDNNKYHVDIIHDRVKLFFSLVENSKALEKVQEIPEKIDEYDLLFQRFISDVIMSTLSNSISNITSFFNTNNNRKEYTELFEEIFFSDYFSFEDQLNSYLSILYPNNKNNTLENTKQHNDILEVAQQHNDIIYFNIPKLLIPWYIYSLSYAVESEITLYNYNKMNIVRESILPLHYTKSKNPIESEIFIRAQRDFKEFIFALKKHKNVEKQEINKSLNLYLFNEKTNLLDLNRALNMFVDNSQYIRFEEYELKVTSKDKLFHEDSKKYKFKEISKISKINNLGVKSLLIDDLYYNETLFLNKMVWLMFNQLFSEMKRSLIEFVENEYLNYLGHIPEKIRTDFVIYYAFSQSEPFDDILEELSDDDIKIHRNLGSEKSLERSLFDAYGYAYKSFYRARNPLRNKNNKQNSIAKRRTMLSDFYK